MGTEQLYTEVWSYASTRPCFASNVHAGEMEWLPLLVHSMFCVAVAEIPSTCSYVAVGCNSCCNCSHARGISNAVYMYLYMYTVSFGMGCCPSSMLV